MAQVIPVSSLDSINYLIYPEQNQNTVQYIQNQMSRFSNTITETGRRFIESARQTYEQINNPEAIQRAKSVLRKVKGFLHPNRIVQLNTLEELRAAQPVMQRFIMSQPTLRRIFHEQGCDGFSDSYVDFQPGKIGEEDYNYRRVMHGIVRERELDNGETELFYRNYQEDLVEGDKELTSEEKFDINNTYDVIELFVSRGEDVSNILGGKL